MASTPPGTPDAKEPADPLTRSLLEAGGLDALVLSDSPELAVMAPEERLASMRRMLDARPDGPVWLFAYGSLIWNPAVHVAERRRARINGWQRAFCLLTHAGRGSPDRPGLVLGLEPGGSCEGIALRIDEAGLEQELAMLWQREMLTGAYRPIWAEVYDGAGEPFGSAIAFTMDHASFQYAGNLDRNEVVRCLATGSGSLGTSADYLFRTVESLRACGISDPPLDHLAIDVARLLREDGQR